jgi:hypothetical protein
MKKLLILISIIIFSCNDTDVVNNDITLVINNNYDIVTTTRTDIEEIEFEKIKFTASKNNKEVFSCNFISFDGINYRLENYYKDSWFFKDFDFKDLKVYDLNAQLIGRTENLVEDQSTEVGFRKADFLSSEFISKNKDKEFNINFRHTHILFEVIFEGQDFEDENSFKNYINNLHLTFHTKGSDIKPNIVRDENGDVKKFRAIIPIKYAPSKNKNKLFSFNNIDNTKIYESTYNFEWDFNEGTIMRVNVIYSNDMILFRYKTSPLNDNYANQFVSINDYNTIKIK